MDKIVEALLEYETITAEQIENIVAGRDLNDSGDIVVDIPSEN